MVEGLLARKMSAENGAGQNGGEKRKIEEEGLLNVLRGEVEEAMKKKLLLAVLFYQALQLKNLLKEKYWQ